MFPTLSSILHYIFGINVQLPIQTFGLWVAVAFVAAYWAFVQEFKRKEKLGYIHSFEKEVTVGAPASPVDLAGNGLFGFILGYKLADMLFNYHAMVDDPQSFILSLRGNWIGGILLAAVFVY